MGRPRKPLSVQIAEGDPRQRGKHKLLERLNAEPSTKRGYPECPEQLTARARKMWEFLTEEIAYMDLDRRPDAVALEALCVNYAMAVEADLEIQRDGITIREPILNRDGEGIGSHIKVHPSVAVSNKAWAHVRAFCGEFGLTPVSRTRIGAARDPKMKPDDLIELLSKPREKRAAETVQ